VDSSMKQIQLQTTRAVSSSSLFIAFSDYTRYQKYWLAATRKMNVQDVKGTAQLEMEIQKFEFDQQLEFPFQIPGNYSIAK
jgi:hypothetical protein